MVKAFALDPILLIAIPLGLAFLLPLIGRLGAGAVRGVQFLTVLFTALLSTAWLSGLISGDLSAVNILTGGYDGPIGINLHYGFAESTLCLLASLTALGSIFYLGEREDDETRGRSGLLQLLILIGAFGLIMTRDLFNMFVFLEIASIGTYALVAFGEEDRSLEAGFKYVLMGAMASTFLLIAIAFLYKLTGTLNIDHMVGLVPHGVGVALPIIFLFLLAGMAIELKLLPVNGPALDLYEGADPGVMALLVGTTVNGVLFAFWKLLPLFPGNWHTIIMALGMVTFVGANLLAIAQDRPRRMLGYSSSAQIGLLVFLLPLVLNGHVTMMAAGLLLVNHTLAKAGLLWLAGAHGGESHEDWLGAFRNSTFARTALILFILAIAGLPPFPGFWGKWQALQGMMTSGHGWWMLPLLLGSLFEFVYYFGWYRRVQSSPKNESADTGFTFSLGSGGTLVFLALSALIGLGQMGSLPLANDLTFLLLGGMGVALIVARRLLKGLQPLVMLLTLAAAGWLLYAGDLLVPSTLSGLFLLMIMGGGLVIAIAGLGLKVRRDSFQGLFLILIASLVLMVRAESLLAFFVAWEIMTWVSYLIVGFGRRAASPSHLYMVFSGAAGFLILGAMMLAMSSGHDTISSLATLPAESAFWVWILFSLGFLVKAAAWGTHIWAPGAYSEAPDLFTPFLSGVISKIPMFGLAFVAFRVGTDHLPVLNGTIDMTWLLAVLGALTAFGLTLLAVFQEDAKRLLAYSSVGQVGYVIVGLAIMSPLGWSAALFQAVHHLLFKGLLFLAIAGVILRTGTRTMHDMGGLIKKMPLSFVSVLIGIIALSGVPPLAGFASKWLLYHALLERGWYFLLAVMMFSSVVAFIYMFRLIHTVFLGQLKTVHRDVKEAPLPLIVAQYVLIAGLMVLAVYPQILLQPLNAMGLQQFGSAALTFSAGGFLTTAGGHFNAMAMMMLVMILFVVMGVFLLVFGPKTTKVGQLDIGYSGEVPPPPEELHYAANFAQPYGRAWAPLLHPRVLQFWQTFSENVSGIVDLVRRFYTGNGQTYILYTVMMVVVFALLGVGR